MRQSSAELLNNARPAAAPPKDPDSRTAYSASPGSPSMPSTINLAEPATSTIDLPADRSFRTTLPGHEHLHAGNNST